MWKCYLLTLPKPATCISFEDGLKQAESSHNRPTLLLGNGFGIAYDANILSYKALFRYVDWSKAGRVQRVFESLKTWDFELAIRNIARSAASSRTGGAGVGIFSDCSDQGREV